MMMQQQRDQHGLNKQFFIGSSNGQFNNVNSSAMSTTGNPQNPINSVDMMQNHLSMIHQSPTLSPTSANLLSQGGQPYI